MKICDFSVVIFRCILIQFIFYHTFAVIWPAVIIQFQNLQCFLANHLILVFIVQQQTEAAILCSICLSDLTLPATQVCTIQALIAHYTNLKEIS